jgi:hypothetical protein
MASSNQTVSLYYTGDVNPANIEARELIQILSAFNRIATKASRAYHGSSVKTSVRIERVQPGSIDLKWIAVGADWRSAIHLKAKAE